MLVKKVFTIGGVGVGAREGTGDGLALGVGFEDGVGVGVGVREGLGNGVGVGVGFEEVVGGRTRGGGRTTGLPY